MYAFMGYHVSMFNFTRSHVRDLPALGVSSRGSGKDAAMTEKQAWHIYHNSPAVLSKWEHVAGSDYCKMYNLPYGGGLVLQGCSHCGKFQTRETYVSGFWAETIELVTSYECAGISKCKCGKWSHW